MAKHARRTSKRRKKTALPTKVHALLKRSRLIDRALHQMKRIRHEWQKLLTAESTIRSLDARLLTKALRLPSTISGRDQARACRNYQNQHRKEQRLDNTIELLKLAADLHQRALTEYVQGHKDALRKHDSPKERTATQRIAHEYQNGRNLLLNIRRTENRLSHIQRCERQTL